MGGSENHGPSILRVIRIKMTEGEDRQQTWRLVLCCVGWVLSALLCNFLLQWTLTIASSMTSPGAADAISLGVGLTQVVFLLACVKVDSSQSGNASNVEALVVSVCSMLLGAAVNSLWLHVSSKLVAASPSTFWDPVVAMALVALTTGEVPSLMTFISVMAVCLGLSGIPPHLAALLTMDRVTLVKFLRGVFAALTCIVVNGLQSEGVTFGLRSHNALLGIVTMATASAAMFGYWMGTHWAGPAIGVVATCLLNGAATCLLLGVVLKRLGVVGVVMMGLTGQLLEKAVLLAATPHDQSLVVSLGSVAVAVLGLALYVKSVFEVQGTTYSKPVSSNERITRVQFLLFVFMTFGMVFYVLQPKVSERDFQNLRFVGLEGVMRKLLQVPEKVAH